MLTENKLTEGWGGKYSLSVNSSQQGVPSPHFQRSSSINSFLSSDVNLPPTSVPSPPFCSPLLLTQWSAVKPFVSKRHLLTGVALSGLLYTILRRSSLTNTEGDLWQIDELWTSHTSHQDFRPSCENSGHRTFIRMYNKLWLCNLVRFWWLTKQEKVRFFNCSWRSWQRAQWSIKTKCLPEKNN